MNPLGYALVGCGAFGRFCLDAQATNPDLKRVAVCDQDDALAAKTARETGIPARTLEEILHDPQVEMVHLATPPWTHRELGEKILKAGKHLLCEKPLALRIEDADALLQAAKENNRLLMVNLIMRHTPIVALVDQILATGALGQPIRASLENDAQDENLPASHWFWDPARSGGIFVEHSVHFFDLFAHWFGTGHVVAAATAHRTDGREDRVHAVSLHDQTLITQTHDFTQAKPIDRQRWRLVFSHGEISLEEWIPVRLKLNGFFTPEERVKLQALDLHEVATDPQSRPSTNYDEPRPLTVYAEWTADALDKQALYADAVRALASDLAKAARDPAHRRVTDEGNARESLRMALNAREMGAQKEV